MFGSVQISVDHKQCISRQKFDLAKTIKDLLFRGFIPCEMSLCLDKEAISKVSSWLLVSESIRSSMDEVV